MSLTLPAVIHDAEALDLQTQLCSKLTTERVRLLKQQEEWKKRAQRAEIEASSLRKPELSACKENATLRTQLVETQSQLSALKLEIEVEKDKRVAAEHAKDQLLSQHVALSTENARLRQETEEVGRGREDHSGENLTLLTELNSLREAMVTLRVELEGKDREVRELAENVQALQVQLENAQSAQPEARPSISSQLDAVGQELGYQAIMEERRNFQEQLAAAHKENEELKEKVASLEVAIQSGTVASSALQRPGSQAEASASRPKSTQPCGKKTRNGKKTGPVDFTQYASPIPRARAEILDSYPEVDVSVSPELAGPFSFTKTELSQLLGGATQGLFVRVTKSARPLAVKYDISEYLCPNLNQNSWLPTKPGAHGYMQVGLGDRDRARFNEPEIRPVFVGAESQFRYFGTYELTRVERLTVEEWLTLPDKSQYEYSETTKDKEKEQRGRNVDDILEDYRSGKLRAPCVLLKCIGFDMDFYRDFVDASRTYSAAFGTVATVSSQAPSAPPAPAAKKGRKRTAGNRFHMEGAEEGVEGEQEGGSSPKRRRMSKAPTANALRTSMRRSGRLSTKLPAAGRTVNEDDDGDGVSSGSGTEFNGDDD